MSWCACLALLAATTVSGQTPGREAEVPPVFSALQGTWVGEGTLMSRDARFEMEWRLEQGGFVELVFSNAFVDAAGNVTPVLRARALYRTTGATALGVWIDTRPQRIHLESEITETSVITEWTAPEERGRTEYLIEGDGVTVRDYVEVDGEMRLFGEATYQRAAGRD